MRINKVICMMGLVVVLVGCCPRNDKPSAADIVQAELARIEDQNRARYYFAPNISEGVARISTSYEGVVFVGHWSSEGVIGTARGLEMLEAVLTIEDWLTVDDQPLYLVCAPDRFDTMVGEASADPRHNRIWFYCDTPGPAAIIHEFGHLIDYYLYDHDRPGSAALLLGWGWATDEDGRRYWVWPREAAVSDYAIENGVWEDWADSLVLWVFEQHDEHPGGRFRNIDEGRRHIFDALLGQSNPWLRTYSPEVLSDR